MFVRLFAALLAGAALVLGAASVASAATPAPNPSGAAQLTVGTPSAKPGDMVKITGTGWSPGAMVNIAVCGQNGAGGTRTCAATTSMNTHVQSGGSLNLSFKVETPPVPCPCVIRVVTVTGGSSLDRNVPIEIVGAPFAALPDSGKAPGRLTFVSSRMTGKDSVFTWFGSPVSRRFEIEVGNMGEQPLTNPVFKIGTFEGVFAPTWEDKTWQGTIQPGQRVTISLPIELKPRQHGEFRYRVIYENKVVDEVALKVGRPWGVYLFGGLLIVVVPMTVWRLGASLVHAIKDHRRELAEERDREVGIPGKSIIQRAGAEADVPAAEPVLARSGAPTGSAPLRRVEETMVVGAPLFASPGPERPGRTDSGASQGISSDAETRVLPPAVRRGGSDADEAHGEPAPSDPWSPFEPVIAPKSDRPSSAPPLVSPADVARDLAWNPGEPGESGESGEEERG